MPPEQASQPPSVGPDPLSDPAIAQLHAQLFGLPYTPPASAPLVSAGSGLDAAALAALHAQADAHARQVNPFDRFDTPPATATTKAPSANPFDRFDAPPPGFTVDAPPVGQPSLPPGYTLDTPATSSAALPAGYKLDAPPPGFVPEAPRASNQFVTNTPAAAAPVHGTGLLDQVGGVIGRGVMDGVTGLIGSAQAAGRFVENHTPRMGDLSKADDFLDNAPLMQKAQDEEDRQGFYRPTTALGKIPEAAISGATGAALSGGTSALPLLM